MIVEWGVVDVHQLIIAQRPHCSTLYYNRPFRHFIHGQKRWNLSETKRREEEKKENGFQLDRGKTTNLQHGKASGECE